MAGTSNSLILPQTVKAPTYMARPVAANTTFSGTSVGNLVLMYNSPTTGNNAGSMMTRLRARPIYAAGSTAFTATQAQLFKFDGTNLIFDDDVLIPAQTLALSAATVPGDFGYSETIKRYLPAGWSWYVGIGVAWTPGVAFSGDILDF